MSGHIFRLDIPAHQAVQELLPWLVSAQLGLEEAERVRQHLLGCAECRQDVERERRMRARGPGMPDGVDVERALARLMPRLGAQDAAPVSTPVSTPVSMPVSTTVSTPTSTPTSAPAFAADLDAGADTDSTSISAPAATPPPPPPKNPWPRSAANQPSWMRWALAIQGIVIAGLLAWQVWPGSGHAGYHALGAAGNAAANLVVVFKPETAEKELRRVLLANGARVVDGPTDTDAYLLSVPLATRDRAVHNLRAEPSVTLAESLQAGAPP
ncbi:zf-HC2 domain-containing protein [Rugamonas sp.]|uniref:zf-HC2 domain-containing protein n=1 Tax=Rugamonas sp. TaxID=1926287 RepID=UPI0025D68008|nr:zf-HC2 domain-containing protein [Rugamonas sp.]